MTVMQNQLHCHSEEQGDEESAFSFGTTRTIDFCINKAKLRP